MLTWSSYFILFNGISYLTKSYILLVDPKGKHRYAIRLIYIEACIWFFNNSFGFIICILNRAFILTKTGTLNIAFLMWWKYATKEVKHAISRIVCICHDEKENRQALVCMHVFRWKKNILFDYAFYILQYDMGPDRQMNGLWMKPFKNENSIHFDAWNIHEKIALYYLCTMAYISFHFDEIWSTRYTKKEVSHFFSFRFFNNIKLIEVFFFSFTNYISIRSGHSTLSHGFFLSMCKLLGTMNK